MASVIRLNTFAEVIKKYEEILRRKVGLLRIHKPILNNGGGVMREISCFQESGYLLRYPVLKMFLVGLTGGIATGKSSVSAMLSSMGVKVIDADLIAREVVEPNKKAWKRIKKEFGNSVFNSDDTINRQALGQIVFADDGKRRLLNSIVHPEIYNSIFKKCLRLFFTGHQFAVLDLPLLFESGKMVRFIHKTIVVACDPAMQLQRLMNRDNLNEPDAVARINAQMPLSEKVSRADFVINNNESLESTKQQVNNVVLELRRLKTHWKYRAVFVLCSALPISLLGYGVYRLYVHYK